MLTLTEEVPPCSLSMNKEGEQARGINELLDDYDPHLLLFPDWFFCALCLSLVLCSDVCRGTLHTLVPLVNPGSVPLS